MSPEKRSYYKYRPLYSDRSGNVPHGFTQSLIASSRLFYATPTSFNDPFDCNLQLHTNDSTDADWIDHINKLIAEHPDQCKKLNVIKSQKRWKTDPKLSDIWLNTRRKIYEKSSVLCLSKRPDSIPMFSYYADDHHGIVVELEFSEIEIPCGIACGDLSSPENIYEGKIIIGDIVYLPNLPDLNYHRLRGTSQLVTSLMFTKFDGWGHEEEFRVFRNGIAASPVKFPAQMLKRIIFGLRTGPAEVDLVKHWLNSHGHPVILAKAKVSTNRFGLDVSDFDIYKP